MHKESSQCLFIWWWESCGDGLGAGYMIWACTHFFILRDGLLPMTMGEHMAIAVFLISALTCLAFR